ncbi:MAG: hypothetical protein PHF44_04075 [Candidatus Pacebacteria bacterium]|nr:hypothetical protein [Candidatus Paceibacterota bacterium]
MEKKVWLISVNMGYGHQRTAFALRDLAFGGKNINANDYEGIPENDRNVWEFTRKSYEAISDFKRFPLLGNAFFSLMDYFQRILSFYPKRDLSKPNTQLKQIFSQIKKGWGRHLIERLKENPLPIISTFFTPAFMAEYFDYPGEIFCVVCDADVSRTWASLNPKESKIKYFAPTERVVERLKLYGVKPENIFFTGYPLPLENIGSRDMEILKEDLKFRLLNLDPKKRYFNKYKTLIEENLGKLPEESDHPLTIMFSVGGAGAQKEIGLKIFKKLSEKIKNGKIKLILSAGIRKRVKDYFESEISKGMFPVNSNAEILFGENIKEYFQKFNLALRKTDILWTKPSELSFYAALALPIIIAPTIGSQEEFNMRWLLKSGLGELQENPNYINQWMPDWLDNGYLAECAMEGFIEGEKFGVENIKKIVCGY